MAMQVPNYGSGPGTNTGDKNYDINEKWLANFQEVYGRFSTVPRNTKTGAYTLALADAGTIVETNSASAINVTVDTAAAVPFPDNTVIEVFTYGAGLTTIVAASGVTIRREGTMTLTARAQYTSMVLRKRTGDEWILFGAAEA